MKLNELKTIKQKEKSKRVGRGSGSGKGTYSGRGIKGQKSRSGYKIPDSPLIAKLPKLRGQGVFVSKKPPVYIVNLEDLERYYQNNELVSPQSLVQKGLIKPQGKDKNFRVKILSQGTLSKKLQFAKELLYSKKAQEKINQIKAN